MTYRAQDMRIRTPEQSSGRRAQTSPGEAVGQFSQRRAIGDLDSVESQSSGQAAEPAEGEVGVGRDRQTASLMYQLNSLAGTSAGGWIRVYVQRKQMSIGGRDLGANDDLRSFATKFVPDSQGSLDAVMVRDRSHSQLAVHECGRHLTRTGSSVTARRMDMEIRE